MAYSEVLASRIRKVFAPQHEVSERKMFGGLTFMVCGHMCCGVMQDKLVVRVGADKARIALQRPHTTPFDVTGKPMSGIVVIAGPGIDTAVSLRRWVQEAINFVSTFPAKGGRRK